MKNESIMSDVFKEGHRGWNPLSSTLTEGKDRSVSSNSLVPQNKPMNTHPELSSSLKSGHMNTDGYRTGASLPAGNESDMVQDIWKRLAQLHPHGEAIPTYATNPREQQRLMTGDDSVLLREQQFQAGLQDLSDKLHRSDLHVVRDREHGLTEDVEGRSSWQGREKSNVTQLEEIQNLLKSKLDEVKSGIELVD